MLLIALLNTQSVKSEDPYIPAIHQANDCMKQTKSVPNGVLYQVETEDKLTFPVMHLYGTPYEMGYAQGELLGKDLYKFITVGLDRYYSQEIHSIPLDGLPKFLQKLIYGSLTALAPSTADKVLAWVYKTEKEFFGEIDIDIDEELHGIAEGVCATITPDELHDLKEKTCDVNKLWNKLRHVNVLPDLIRMQCSLMGAWGDAIKEGDAMKSGDQRNLIQLRALDFGGGPFADASVMVIYHPSTEGHNDFMSLTFPGLSSVVTGASKYLGLSEKVLLKPTPPKGTYKGVADTIVLRGMLELTSSRDEALSLAQSVHRTWGIWLGMGDSTTMDLKAIQYEMDGITEFDDMTTIQATNQTSYRDVVYVDKHVQPSDDQTFPKVIGQNYGKINKEIAAGMAHVCESGDVHIMVLDHGAGRALVAVGETDEKTGQFTRYAYNSPFVDFDLHALLDMTREDHSQ